MPQPIFPQTTFVDESTGRLNRVWQQYFVNLTNFPTATTATAGEGVLPNKPVGFLIINIAGSDVKVPYYNL